MKNRTLLLLALFIFAIGWTVDSTSSEITVTKKKVVTKTIKFHQITGTIEFDYSPTNVCGIGFMSVLIQGEGNASHLGRYRVVNTYCATTSGNPVSPIYGFLTAANGDEIHTQLTGSAPGAFYYTVFGGTGRFDGVTGEMSLYGTVDPVNGVWTLEGEGTITY